MAALWADKYRPKDIGGLDYNVNQLNMLKQMVSTDDFPHLLFVGPDGCGKRTRMRCLLKEIYGEGIFQMKHIEIPLETAGGKAIKIRAVDSKYHIEVRPSDLAFHDRMVVQKVIKDIAGTAVDPLIYKKPFRVVVMEEADLLTFDAQQALRRTMEKYASTCKLFLCCTSLNKIIEPLISRCMVVRLPAPTAEEAVQVLKTVAQKEVLNASDGFFELLARQCDRNLRRCLLTLEASVAKFGKNTFFESSKQIAVPDWRQHIRFLTDKLMTKPDADGVLQSRQMLYDLINRLMPTNIIFEFLTIELAKRVNDREKLALYKAASKFQHLSLAGDKPLIFIEAFLLNFLADRADLSAK